LKNSGTKGTYMHSSIGRAFDYNQKVVGSNPTALRDFGPLEFDSLNFAAY
jgi:hypothetical protein